MITHVLLREGLLHWADLAQHSCNAELRLVFRTDFGKLQSTEDKEL